MMPRSGEDHSREWKVGLVGCGKIAGVRDAPHDETSVRTHAQAYFRHPDFRLVACVEPHMAKLRAFQDVWQVPRGYSTLKDLLEREQVDVLSLCSPSEVHFIQALEAVTSRNKPKVLFVEKPVCFREEEIAQLTTLAQERHVAVLVNHTRRFDPAYWELARKMQAGEFGDLIEGRCTYYGGWLTNGTHLVDTVRMLFGREPKIASARFSDHGRGDDLNLDTEFQIGDARIKMEGVDESKYQILDCEFRFELGRIQLLDFGERIVMEQVEVNELDERILMPMAQSPIYALNAALAGAVTSIDEHLNGQESFRRIGVDLHTVGKTMQFIWDSQAIAASCGVGVY